MMSTKPAFRRKRYLIKKGLQFRYIGLIFALALLASLITGYTVFATVWTLLGEKLANVYPQGRLLYVLRATNLALIRNLVFASPFIFMLGLLFSHKIAGPVYRIERTIYEIANGNLTSRVKLRKGDELWDLADVLNTMLERLKGDIVLNKNILSEIQKDLDNIKNAISDQSLGRGNIEQSVNDLQSKIKNLSSSLDKWNTSSSRKA